ncbi:MAG: hypothetical protein ABI333_21500 [bacterium]
MDRPSVFDRLLALPLGACLFLACGPAAPPPRGADGAGALPAGVRKRICASVCSGRIATIRVWRDTKGRIGALKYDGDPGTCSHPPAIYFSPTGVERLVIPMKPVSVGSAEYRKVLALHDRETRGLRRAEELRCGGGGEGSR